MNAVTEQMLAVNTSLPAFQKTTPGYHNRSDNDTVLQDVLLSSNLASYSELALKMIYIIIGSLGLAGNILVIVVIFNYTAMRKKITNIFIINQSFTDAASSICVLGVGIFTHNGQGLQGVSGELICSLWLTRAPLWSFLMSSTYNLLALTIERYLEIVHPVWHKNHFSPRMAYWMIAFVWVFGPVYNLAYEVPTSQVINGKCFPFAIWPSPLVQSLVGILTAVLQYILPIVILAYCYSRMALVIHRRISPTVMVQAAYTANATSPAPPPSPLSLVPTHSSSSPTLAENGTQSNTLQPQRWLNPSASAVDISPNAENNTIPSVPSQASMNTTPIPSLASRKMMKARSNIIKTLFIVSICYILCWTWNEIFILLYFLGRPTDFSSTFYHFTVVAVFFNCCINPFIYIAKYEHFQEGLRKLFGRCWRRHPRPQMLIGGQSMATTTTSSAIKAAPVAYRTR